MLLTLEEKKKTVSDLTRDPKELSRILFGSTWWSKQEEIVRSVWDFEKTAVASCNSGGKSKIAAEITVLYLLCFPPARVITTAPTFTQVEEILWKEIASLHLRVEHILGGKLNATSLDLGVVDGKPWDAMGISTNEVNRFQGFKSPHLLVILDEALGVGPEIWEAMEGLHPHRVLALGNPLEAEGDFYNCFQSPFWNKITIDGEDCVAWQREHGEIPGLITQKWIDERAEEWGRGSPLFQARVKGIFPEETAETLISRKWVERARKGLDEAGNTLTEEREEDVVRVGALDAATKHGECETVFGYRYGHTIPFMKGFYRINAVESATKAEKLYNNKQLHNLAIDSDGFGEGISDILIDKKIGVDEFHGGHSHEAIDSNRYANLRTQFYHIVAKKFEKGMYNLSKMDPKIYELLKNQLCCIKTKAPDALRRMRIETKDDLAARSIKSPDYADAFIYLEYAWWSAKFSDIKPILYR